MRTTGMKLIGVIGLLVTLSMVMGCGSSDLLDELATQYNGVAYSVDNNDRTNEIDVIQIADCDYDPTTNPPEVEPFLPFDAEVEIDSDVTAAEFRVESYTVRFRPNHGSMNGTQITAANLPDLAGTTINPITHNISSEIIEPGSSTTLDLLVWPQGDKVVYATIVAGVFGTAVGTDFVYDMQVVLNCRTLEDESFEITTPWTPVHFANFDNC